MRKFVFAALLAASSFTPVMAQEVEDRTIAIGGPVGERLGGHFGRRMEDRGNRMQGRFERNQQSAQPVIPAPAPQDMRRANRNAENRNVMTAAPSGEWRRQRDGVDATAHSDRNRGEGWRRNRQGGSFDQNNDGNVDRNWDRNRNGRADRNWDRNRDGNLDRNWDRNRDGNLDRRWDNNRDGRLDRRWDTNRDGRVDRGWDRNRDGRPDGRYTHRPSHNWDHNWRRNNRYDWYGYRSRYNDYYRLPRYSNPYGYGYGYRRFGIGVYLDSLFYSSRYWVRDPYHYRLPDAPYGYRWIRYYDDVILVDMRSGYVVDVIHNFFW